MKKITSLFLALFVFLPCVRMVAGETVVVEVSGGKTLAECLENYKTTEFPGYTFAGFSDIVIKGTLQEKDFDVFKRIYAIESVDLSQTNLKDLPTMAFSETSGMNVDGIRTLITVKLPSTIETIGSYAMSNCTALRNLNIEACANLKTIGTEAIFNTQITSLHFGKDLKAFSGTALGSNVLLATVTVDPENPYIEAIDNAVYDKARKELIFYPMGCTASRLVVKEGTLSSATEIFRRQTALEEVVLPEGFQKIPDNAFPECSNLKKINLPESIVSIGEGAFVQTGLETVVIPSKVTALSSGVLQKCPNLKAVTVKGSVTTIASYAFNDSHQLESIVFNDLSKLDGIDIRAFSNCRKLRELDLSGAAKLKAIQMQAFENCESLVSLHLPSCVQSIGNYAFSNCVNLEINAFPSELRSIGKFAFLNNLRLSKIEISATLESIEAGAFSNCPEVKEVIVDDNNPFFVLDEGVLMNAEGTRIVFVVTSAPIRHLVIPDGIARIDDYACAGLQSLESVKLPREVKEIGSYAFAGCPKLTTLDLSSASRLRIIYGSAFADCNSLSEIKWMADRDIDENTGNTEVDDEGNLIQPEKDIFEFREAVFKNCTSLQSVRLPRQLTSIYPFLFEGCTSLETADLTALYYVKNLNSMFVGCSALHTVQFPTEGKLETFGAQIFHGCTSLKTLKVPVLFKSISAISGQMFYNSGIENIEVPEASTVFSSREGFLCSKDGKFLLVCPSNRKGAVVVPEGIEKVYMNAFYKNPEITRIALPSTIGAFGYNCIMNSFIGLPLLEEFTVDAANPNYAVYEGALYSKDLKKLYVYPSGKASELVLHDNLEVIEKNALMHNPHLTRIVIKGNLTNVLQSGFCELPNLEEIDLPASTISVQYAILKCPMLKKVVIRAQDAPQSSNRLFSDCHPDIAVYVPESALSNYTSHKYWKQYPVFALTESSIGSVSTEQSAPIFIVSGARLELLNPEAVAWTEIYSLNGRLLLRTAQPECSLEAYANEPVIIAVRMKSGMVSYQKVVIR